MHELGPPVYEQDSCAATYADDEAASPSLPDDYYYISTDPEPLESSSPSPSSSSPPPPPYDHEDHVAHLVVNPMIRDVYRDLRTQPGWCRSSAKKVALSIHAGCVAAGAMISESLRFNGCGFLLKRRARQVLDGMFDAACLRAVQAVMQAAASAAAVLRSGSSGWAVAAAALAAELIGRVVDLRVVDGEARGYLQDAMAARMKAVLLDLVSRITMQVEVGGGFSVNRIKAGLPRRWGFMPDGAGRFGMGGGEEEM